jgi:hypothetical protein
MIKLYTYPYKEPDEFENSYESIFCRAVMREVPDDFDKEVIKDIDNSTFIAGTALMNDCGQVFDMSDLSRGTQIVLTIKWMLKNMPKEDWKFNVTSCGDNVFKYLVQVIGDKDVELFTFNPIILDETPCHILVDDSYEVDCFEDV